MEQMWKRRWKTREKWKRISQYPGLVCLRFEIPTSPQDRIFIVNMMENDKPLNLQLPYLIGGPYIRNAIILIEKYFSEGLKPPTSYVQTYVVYLKWWIPKPP